MGKDFFPTHDELKRLGVITETEKRAGQWVTVLVGFVCLWTDVRVVSSAKTKNQPVVVALVNFTVSLTRVCKTAPMWPVEHAGFSCQEHVSLVWAS